MSHKVLIADDSATMRSVIKKSLRLSQLPIAEIIEVGNGREALESLGQNPVDLVFADLNMPEMDGDSMIQAMCQSEELKRIPVVVISTEGSVTRVEQLSSPPMAAFLRKPFTPEQFRAVVQQVLPS